MNSLTSKLNKTPYSEITTMYRQMIRDYSEIVGEKSEFGVIITADFLNILRERLRNIHIMKDKLNWV